MGFINVFVGSECNIQIKNKQLLLKKFNGDCMDYPIEDINSILIENQYTTISIQAMNKLVESNIVVYVCDSKHMPTSYLLGYNSFYKNLEVYNYQTDVPKPLLKQLWKAIIIQKISNQGEVLKLTGISNDLVKYTSQIKSGDADNVESVAANKYFKLLFGRDFIRRDNTLINAALNYGYAIIRGAIARSVVAHGLQPYLGMHHCNKLNNFNLVDDLIEPFRPIVDLFVYSIALQINNYIELTSEIKLKLQGILCCDVLVENSIYTLSDAINMLVYSYVNCLKNKSNNLKLPSIIKLKVHKYE